MNFDNIEIRDYLNKKLPPDQIAIFEDRINSDEAFAEEVRFQRLLLESMEAKSFMEVIDSVQKKTALAGSVSSNNQSEEGKIAKRSILPWISAAAAAALVGALFFFLWSTPDNSQTDLLALADKYATNIDLPVDRSTKNPWQPTVLENEVEIPLLQDENSVKLNYSTPAATRIQIANLQGELNPLRILLLGDHHAKQDQPDKAHFYFNLLLDGRFTDFEPQARWQKAILLLRQKKTVEARGLLENLVNLKRDTPIRRSARSLLKELPKQ